MEDDVARRLSEEIVDEIARSIGLTRAELLERVEASKKATGAKVTAVMDNPHVTIDADTGIARVQRQGVMKGFAEGFRDYVMRGVPQKKGRLAPMDLADAKVVQQVTVDVKVGQFPAGHGYEGKYAVQVMFAAFDRREWADDYADRLTPFLEQLMQTKAVRPN